MDFVGVLLSCIVGRLMLLSLELLAQDIKALGAVPTMLGIEFQLIPL